MRSLQTRRFGIGALAMIAILAVPGCVDLGGGGGVVDDDNSFDGTVSDDEVLVIFRNVSPTSAIDVEFHATNNPIANLPDDLFVDSLRLDTGIGVAGTGIITPGAVDGIEFPCTDNLTLGTPGGVFLDNSSGDETGRGDPRWAESLPLGLCGGIVTFTFTESEGAFTTRVTIAR